MSLLGLDKVLQEVGDLGVVVGILALETRDQVLEGNASNVTQVGRTNSHDGVLVEEEIQEGHLADGGEAASVREKTLNEGRNILVKSLVGNGNGAVIVIALVHVSKALAEGGSAVGIPGILMC